MKYLSLQQAMLGMRIVQTDHGMIIKSPAGSTEYDLKGRRIKVNGYPEYFPGQLRVKDKRTPKRATMDMINGMLTVRDGDGTLRVQMGKVFISDASIQDGSITNAKIGTAIVSGHLKNKSDDRLMKAVDEHDPISLKTTAYKFQGAPLPFGGFPGPNVISAKLAVGSSDTKSLLSDDMREAVIDAVRNSEVFQSLVAQLNALSAERESDAVRLQRGIDQALSDTIRNALKPGGSFYGGR
ncbi:hypothetical protein OBQ85_002807 [Salmonella enterica subsp. enterica serovar Uganda]|nr:hypothetical protein [Salmonella enterica]EAN1474760.1 hypothetical protein [Salmonella enterica subsp. enterica serovar Uganda]EJJ1489247.1 hypothetical protein [Salmonella enterica subsp. enterica]EAN5976559.1 hypothetical protein [Salmonella enterica]EAN9697470.1 hypothetical protein [Salmonella enterica]